ncbi:hypothetical protein WMY93_027953 [Mugilogobius chulae]|uniref:SEA domain-containing protein n=1 Tax=Mugilogobius chulae TaxID=88201 RepID=A0AAW0N5F5_9GOBI
MGAQGWRPGTDRSHVPIKDLCLSFCRDKSPSCPAPAVFLALFVSPRQSMCVRMPSTLQIKRQIWPLFPSFPLSSQPSPICLCFMVTHLNPPLRSPTNFLEESRSGKNWPHHFFISIAPIPSDSQHTNLFSSNVHNPSLTGTVTTKFSGFLHLDQVEGQEVFYTPEMEDPKSELFGETARSIESALNELFRKSDVHKDFMSVRVKNLAPSRSILAFVEAHFKPGTKHTVEDIEKALLKQLKASRDTSIAVKKPEDQNIRFNYSLPTIPFFTTTTTTTASVTTPAPAAPPPDLPSPLPM